MKLQKLLALVLTLVLALTLTLPALAAQEESVPPTEEVQHGIAAPGGDAAEEVQAPGGGAAVENPAKNETVPGEEEPSVSGPQASGDAEPPVFLSDPVLSGDELPGVHDLSVDGDLVWRPDAGLERIVVTGDGGAASIVVESGVTGTLVLDGVTITSEHSPAILVMPGAEIAIELRGENTLTARYQVEDTLSDNYFLYPAWVLSFDGMGGSCPDGRLVADGGMGVRRRTPCR